MAVRRRGATAVAKYGGKHSETRYQLRRQKRMSTKRDVAPRSALGEDKHLGSFAWATFGDELQCFLDIWQIFWSVSHLLLSSSVRSSPSSSFLANASAIISLYALLLVSVLETFNKWSPPPSFPLILTFDSIASLRLDHIPSLYVFLGLVP